MHQRRSGDTARLFIVRQGDVIGDDHHLYFQPVAFGFFCREAEVKAVAGVVFNDQQAAPVTGDGNDRVEHSINARRGKHVATDGGSEHSLTYKASVCGLMAGTAAGDHCNAGFIPVGAGNNTNSGVDVEAN